jgi:hypothetical protein
MITLMHRNEDVSVKQSTAQELQQLLGGQLRQERIRQRLEQQEVAAGAGVAWTFAKTWRMIFASLLSSSFQHSALLAWRHT